MTKAAMEGMDHRIKDITATQDKLSHRTDVETEAEKLMVEGRYQEATALLSSLKAETQTGGAVWESK